MKIGETIKQLCKEHEITVQKLETELGFGNGSLANATEKIQFGRILAIANYFGVDVNTLTDSSHIIYKKEIGTNIKHRRCELGLTQEELAKKMHTTRQCISSWEQDRTQPSLALITELSKVLECEPQTLMDIPIENITIEMIETKMQQLDIKDWKRIKAYAEYLIAKKESKHN